MVTLGISQCMCRTHLLARCFSLPPASHQLFLILHSLGHDSCSPRLFQPWPRPCLPYSAPSEGKGSKTSGYMSAQPVAQFKIDLEGPMGLWSHELDSPGRKEVLPFVNYGKDTGQSSKSLRSLPGYWSYKPWIIVSGVEIQGSLHIAEKEVDDSSLKGHDLIVNSDLVNN